jgi:uncharacterized alkaline shock family protein YloU
METKYGKISVGSKLISQIVARAVLESYGIVAFSGSSLKHRLASIFSREAITPDALEIQSDGETINLKVKVVVEFGVNIPEVTRNIGDRIRYDLEKYAGLKTGTIEILVGGVKG